MVRPSSTKASRPWGRRLATPRVTRETLVVHPAAESVFELWRRTARQLAPEALVRIQPAGPVPALEYLHATRTKRGTWQVFAGFAAFQAHQRALLDVARLSAAVIHYDLMGHEEIERLALAHVLHRYEEGCLDTRIGYEQLRRGLRRLDRRSVARVCGSGGTSKRAFAGRINACVSSLKAQAARLKQSSSTDRGALNEIVKRLKP